MLVSNGLASYRVPAAAVTWALVALAREPEVSEECAAAVNPDGTAVPDILRWTIAESLRLWPPNWLILRTAKGEQNCGGWSVPAGAAVMISPYVVHRTAPVFTDPLTFRPHRWASLQPTAGEYLPYGIGSRWCVGKALADLELATVLSTLVARFRFTVDHMDPLPDVRTTLLPARLTLGLRAR
ncbi:cytochrome P450 [Streptomyces californicus]|nr:cytochrome P450 [Streptomyces californicus]